jgi:hypothetical protein
MASGKKDYEVKCLVNPATALDGIQPKQKVKEKLNITDGANARMEFLDGPGRECDAEHWFVRIRAIDTKKDDSIQLTYKKRYALDSAKKPDIEVGEKQAKDDGFFADGIEKYDVQVEWGVEKQVLSLSDKENGKKRDGHSVDLPDDDDARKLALKHLPSMLKKQVPGVEPILANAHVYGPVSGVRWAGTFDGEDLDFEVWLVKQAPGGPDVPLVEASLKKDSHKDAEAAQEKLRELLQKHGWLSEKQEEKTPIILKNYGPKLSPDLAAAAPATPTV